MSDTMGSNNYIELAADIVSAYVSNNSVPASDLPALINDVHSALLRVTAGQPVIVAETPKPAVPPKKSITNEFLVCLEDGRKFKSLKRHLRTQYNMSPDEYREKWVCRRIIRWWRQITPRPVPISPSKWGSASSAGVPPPASADIREYPGRAGTAFPIF